MASAEVRQQAALQFTLIKDYLFGRLKSGLTSSMLTMYVGIGTYLTVIEASRLVDAVGRAAKRTRPVVPLADAISFLENEHLRDLNKLRNVRGAAASAETRGVGLQQSLVHRFDIARPDR